MQVTRTDGYLKATSTTVTGVTGVVSNSLLPGSITTGFQMTVTPRILDRDRVMLSYNIDLSRLLSFTNASVGSGDNQATIQIPNFERRAFIQAVAVKAGDTLLIVESMKMEIPVLCETGGTIAAVHVVEGNVVQEGDVIAEIA